MYVHYPWCAQVCPYCDFAKARVPGGSGRALTGTPYTERILAEFSARAHELEGLRLVSMYFGGGTPSLWGVDEPARVIAAVRARLPGDVREITVECDPADITPDYLAGLKAAGVTRVTLGLQALDDRRLTLLGRGHDRRRGLAAMEALATSGLDWGPDLMTGFRRSRRDHLIATIDEIAAFSPSHVSVYELTIEPGTPFARRTDPLTAPEERRADLLDAVRDRLLDHGYDHVEVSNYARPGRAPVHNRLYWEGRAYLGLGPGAHSMHRTTDGGAVRRAASREIRAHDRAPPALTVEHVDARSHGFEVWMTGLRMTGGIDEADVASRAPAALAAPYAERLARLTAAGVLLRAAGRVYLAPERLWVQDAVLRALAD